MCTTAAIAGPAREDWCFGGGGRAVHGGGVEEKPRCSPDQPAVLARRAGRPQLAQVSEWHFTRSSGAGNMPHLGASDSVALRSHPHHHLHSITPIGQSHVKHSSLIQRQKPRDVDEEDHV